MYGSFALVQPTIPTAKFRTSNCGTTVNNTSAIPQLHKYTHKSPVVSSHNAMPQHPISYYHSVWRQQGQRFLTVLERPLAPADDLGDW